MLTEFEFWKRLNAVAHPAERPLPDEWRSYYWSLYKLALKLQPTRICEIGVRAGYSTYTFFLAQPTCSVTGIDSDGDEAKEDTHGGRKGYWRHALQILRRYDFQLFIVDSHAIRQLPAIDLVYVDGDHSYDGCLSDLQLAAESSDTILVDDYERIADVQSACDEFLFNRLEFYGETFDAGQNGLLLLRKSYTMEQLA